MTWSPEYASGLLVSGASQSDLRRCFELLPDEGHYERLTKHECAEIGLPYFRPAAHSLAGARPVVSSSIEYPAALRSTPNPPSLIYIKGHIESGGKALAVVGTRRCTRLGLNVAKASVEAVASVGGFTVSGLAVGCDTAAHEESIKAGVRTIAVLACGIDMVYPRENKTLASRILDSGGALLSEQPPGVTASPQRLMMRNRIIAGSSYGLIPAECPADSRGTLNAVKVAHDYGRFIFMARARGRYRGTPGAWLTESYLDNPREVSRILGKNGSVFAPNFVAESADDLKDAVKIATVLTDFVL